MFLDSRILFIFTETPLHAGSGSGLGAVDLPIQRERTTGYPIVQASGVKGALRSEATDGPEKTAIFGPEVSQAEEASQTVSLHAGALSPGDARILLFPVRSLKGVFAWTTSMLALHRFRRDAQAAGLSLPPLPSDEPGGNQAYVSGEGVVAEGRIVLEEFAFSVADAPEENEKAARLAGMLAQQALPLGDVYDYWRAKLRDSLVILPNDAFRDFLLHATEVATRVRLDPDSKTVMRGALWTEEHLPTDSLLYAPLHATRLRIQDAQAAGWPESALDQARAVLNWVSDVDNIPHRFQLGGDETVGRGMVHTRWNGGAA
jgi:CRISPR-associated protein Cmr4